MELILPLALANGKKNPFNFQDFSPIFIGLKPLLEYKNLNPLAKANGNRITKSL